MNASGHAQVDFRAVAPTLAQWYGILIGPITFGFDLLLSYALVPHACSTGHHYVLHVITVAALAVIATGFVSSWMVHQRVPEGASAAGGDPVDRARFLAELGLLFSIFSAVLVIANALPRFILSPCD
jgi:hypothetical protein